MVLKGAIGGRFHVTETIGAGGMGEVYRARDDRLQREVALKILPERLAGDSGRLARFEHEARAVAALNHPNILALYDLGYHDGSPYLVTELLEGESLRGRLAAGPLPVKDAVRLAVQLAHGLAAAHAKGVVHRDLKPENVFVTRDGTVKVLDFGLATLRAAPVSMADAAEAPTETQLTGVGTILGTVGYMAPEQVRGTRVDHRADIFAFGCVLYEMLAGRRAYARDTPADTLGAILQDEPEPVELASGEVTPALAQLVRRCLEKRPDDRFSSAHDLALALQAAVSGVDAGLAGAVAAAHPGRRRRALLGAMVAVLVVAAVAGLLWVRGGRFRGAPEAPLAPSKVMVAPFENLTGDPALDAVGRMAGDAISEGLLQIGGVELVSPGGAAASASAPGSDPWVERARERGAGTLVSGACYLSGDTLELRTRVTDAATGELLYALDPDSGPRDEQRAVVAAVRERVMGAIAYYTSTIRGMLGKPIRYKAFREFEAGMVASGIDWPAALKHFRRVVELEPGCWMARIRVAVALRSTGQKDAAGETWTEVKEHEAELAPVEQLFVKFDDARRSGNRAETLAFGRQLHQLVPTDEVMAFFAAMSAVDLNRPREALQLLGDPSAFHWNRWGRVPQGEWVLRLYAWSHHFLGDYEAELADADLNLRLYPSSQRGRENKVRALAALGRLDELDRAVADSQTVLSGHHSAGSVMLAAAEALRAHGHPAEALKMAERGAAWYASRPPEDTEARGSANHAELLWVAGRYEEARRTAEAWSAADPGNLFARGTVGLIAARLGDHATAAAVDDELAGIDRPTLRGYALFYRAAIAAQEGNKERAFELLRDGFAKGLPFEPYIRHYVFLEPLHGYPPFEELIAPKG